MVLREGAASYYAYTTGPGFPILRSGDLATWTGVGKVFKQRPAWIVPLGDPHLWAPSVLRATGGCPATVTPSSTVTPSCYYLYYTGLSGFHAPATECVAVAVSPSPVGPFRDLGPITASNGSVDRSGRPIGCGDDRGYGNIDPAPFVDVDGRAYLYVATDRSCRRVRPGRTCPFSPTISVIPLAPDLVHARGRRKPLISGARASWEQQAGGPPNIENPWMVRRRSRYYLLYSAGSFAAAYGMGYVVARTALGNPGRRWPRAFAKFRRNPVLRENASVRSPGGGSVVQGRGGGQWLVYQGRTRHYCQPRTLRLDRLLWRERGIARVKGPTSTPQPLLP